MAKVGRPTKYKKNYHPKRFIELSADGKYLCQICAEFGIARDTLYEWKKNHQEFSDSMTRGYEARMAFHMEDAEGLARKQGISHQMKIFLLSNMFHKDLQIKRNVEVEAGPETRKTIKLAYSLDDE